MLLKNFPLPNRRNDIPRRLQYRHWGSGAGIREDGQVSTTKKQAIAIAGVGRQLKLFVRLFAIGLVVFCSSPGNAISERIESFPPATPEEAARWIGLLQLGTDAGVHIKSATFQLRDVAMSVTRVESSTCTQDVCPTIFKYQMDNVFEFIIPCKEGLVALDMARRDPSGKYVVSIELATGDNLTTLVTPTSLGPIIITLQQKLFP